MKNHKIKISKLSHSWIFDLDGTLLKHNNYLFGKDRLLKGVKSLWKKIPTNDTIIILTAREKKFKKQTIEFLNQNGIRFDHIIFGLPYGERILINDKKPSGLKTALSLNLNRNEGLHNIIIQEDSKI